MQRNRSRHREIKLVASFVGLASLNGCSALDNWSSSQGVTGGAACDGVELDASRQYKPKSWTDAHVAFTAGSLSFAVPASIPVVTGNAGTGKTKFTFSLDGGVPITCVYRGNGGTTYAFTRCKQGPIVTPDLDDDDNDHDDVGAPDPLPVAGTVVEADTFTLHVNRGDKRDGTTAVVLHLGGPVISDNNLCTIDACTDGDVTHTPVDIDDHDDCTVDACDPVLGTTHTLVDTPFCRGRQNFHDTELAGLGGNGRACSTCHGDSTAFQLSPADAQARFAASGGTDPLFQSLDANDHASDYSNLLNGLVRVTIPLGPNVRLLDCGSQIPCPASAQPTNETTVDVWRSVPSVFNVANTGPDGLAPAWPRGPNTHGGYQLDARVDTLQNQALGALHGHAAITVDPAAGFLDDIAAYEQTLFTPPAGTLSALEQQGKAVFDRSCGQCHNGPAMSTTLVTGRYVDLRTAFPRPADTVSPPRWQFPTPAIPLAQNVRTYEFTFADGFKLRKTTTDAGRAILTGFVFSAAAPVPPAVCAHAPCGAATGDDFQKFDMPQLHGIANTAPYFHNNSAATLNDVLDHYDQLFLQLEATNPVSPVVTSQPGLTPPVFDRPLKRVSEDGGVERTALLAYLATL